jgi:hypothetical protein
VASVEKNGQTILVGAGKSIELGGSNANVEKFDKEATDALDRWAKRRAEQLAMANPSSAKQVHDYGCRGTSFAANNGTNPCMNPCGGWRYNPWYGLVTYIPCTANIYSPYGWRYYSPYNVMRAYYVPPAPTYHPGYNAGNNFPSYNTMGTTSAGYSGAMSTSSASVASAPAAASAGTTSSSSAASSSAGHGGGGHGR